MVVSQGQVACSIVLSMCAVRRGNAVVSYEYTAFGDVASTAQSVVTFPPYEQASSKLSYSYDAAGRLQNMVYPSGNKIAYTYDAAGNAFRVILNDGEAGLVTTAQYYPFGPQKIVMRGNGSTIFGLRDQGYRPWITGNGGYFYDVVYYDANGNPTVFYSSEGGKAHAYDALDRLQTSSGPYGERGFDYDKNANRLFKNTDGVFSNYSYDASSNRMRTNASGTVFLDENGNTVSLDGMAIHYTADNRVRSVAGRAGYDYNGIGERVLKALPAPGRAGSYGITFKTVYMYSRDGKLIAELGSSGRVQQEYIYLNDQLLAVIVYKPGTAGPILNADMDADGAVGVDDFLVWYFNHFNAGDTSREVNGDSLLDINDIKLVLDCALSGGAAEGCAATGYEKTIYYAHNDHLGTPHMLSDEKGVAVWAAVYAPFGAAKVNDDLDADGTHVTLNIRFPGQYYDAESGLHYNYHRYYDPDSGRYITADPIGLAGGINMYGYVEGMPLRYIDPLGLLRKGRNARNFSKTINRQGSVALGIGTAAQFGPLGFSTSLSIGIDVENKVCFVSVTCGRSGNGLFGGVGLNASVEKTSFCSGTKLINGAFIEGGDVFAASGSIDSEGFGAGFGGLGAGSAHGYQRCVVSTLCLN